MSSIHIDHKQGIYTGRKELYENELACYWYQYFPNFSNQKIALLGFASDQGVNRNQGRIGAKYAPQIIKSALAKLPISLRLQKLYSGKLDTLIGDAGEIICLDNDHIVSGLLEDAQHRYSEKVASLIKQEKFVIGLGGGHEIAWGSFLGLYQGLTVFKKHEQRIGIINIDAHLDLRQSPDATSGTPFRQIAEYLGARLQSFNYFCIGISQFSNTAALFERAGKLGVNIISDDDCCRLEWSKIETQILSFIEPLDSLYLTIDLDCLQSGIMPAVSAVAAKGLSLDFVERCILTIIKTGKVRLIDIAEYNPHYDIDGKGEKVVARMLAGIIEQQLQQFM
ncbi:formimidoylglutamase [Vespertiliibacter pulmonis]|uniref:Formimidoylglutamase n=1 Tax=Vespertiliibacter pulmonis TaxID=1443036 RepID=A0A3N4VKQ8_9PAST|nr:formimidoylglutamase [Vespertiliibacter pulmonis]QLB21216.1 formimidoylglutamase [Vespertiliibacter pulmonis]RPE83672.1 formiminoglutamase [Vespertiliibacter pulmonis]